MEQELISIIDVANRLGKRKQTIFKVVKRLGISTRNVKSSLSKNQAVAYVTHEDVQRISEELRLFESGSLPVSSAKAKSIKFVTNEVGVFYLAQLEPYFDPCRFKVGFASSMSERLRALRCSAPYTQVMKTWVCRRLWEKTAIDCISSGCEKIHTEVFRAADLGVVVEKCDAFFSLMPSAK